MPAVIRPTATVMPIWRLAILQTVRIWIVIARPSITVAPSSPPNPRRPQVPLSRWVLEAFQNQKKQRVRDGDVSTPRTCDIRGACREPGRGIDRSRARRPSFPLFFEASGPARPAPSTAEVAIWPRAAAGGRSTETDFPPDPQTRRENGTSVSIRATRVEMGMGRHGNQSCRGDRATRRARDQVHGTSHDAFGHWTSAGG
jgi:hypothetical protein